MKKIIAIVSVIAAITAILCIGASAYNAGDVLERGTIITYAENLEGTTIRDIYPIYFESNGKEFHAIQYLSNTLRYINNPDVNVYNTTNGWIDNKYRTIKLTQDYTLDSSAALMFNSNNVIITQPIINKTVDNTKTAFSTVLFVGSLIISWLVANQICLVGLYLYITIALSATARRFIKGA